MRKLLVPLLFAFTATFFFCAVEASKKEVKNSVVGLIEKIGRSAGKPFGAQLTAMTLSFSALMIIWGIFTQGFDIQNLEAGFFGKKPKWKWFNLIFWSVIYVIGGFYGYLFLEKLFSGKTDSLSKKVLSGTGSFLIMGLWGVLYFDLLSKNFATGIGFLFMYLFVGLGGGLVTSLLPCSVYKGIVGSIDQELRNTH